MRRKKMLWNLFISKKENLSKFHDIMGFNIDRKQDKLENKIYDKGGCLP